MRKFFYIVAFAVVGALAQFIVHGLVEMWYIDKLLADFDTYSLGFSWAEWFTIHSIFTAALFTAGVAFGVWQGMYWWSRVYPARGLKNKRRGKGA
jgi:hypothetical protein